MIGVTKINHPKEWINELGEEGSMESFQKSLKDANATNDHYVINGNINKRKKRWKTVTENLKKAFENNGYCFSNHPPLILINSLFFWVGQAVILTEFNIGRNNLWLDQGKRHALCIIPRNFNIHILERTLVLQVGSKFLFLARGAWQD